MAYNGLEVERWGALWHSKSKLNGVRKHIIFENCLPVLFCTKKEINEYIKKTYGYIATRKDLRVEPHCWRIPKPIKLKITIKNRGVKC